MHYKYKFSMGEHIIYPFGGKVLIGRISDPKGVFAKFEPDLTRLGWDKAFGVLINVHYATVISENTYDTLRGEIVRGIAPYEDKAPWERSPVRAVGFELLPTGTYIVDVDRTSDGALTIVRAMYRMVEVTRD